MMHRAISEFTSELPYYICMGVIMACIAFVVFAAVEDAQKKWPVPAAPAHCDNGGDKPQPL